MMIELTLGAFGVLLGVVLWLLLTIKATVQAQTAAIVAAVGSLEDLQEVASNLADGPDAAAEMMESLGNMHVPTGQDHILSAAASLLQMWGMNKFGGGGSLGQLLGMPVGAAPPSQFETEP